MYAVPARRDGEKIKLAGIGCLECGSELFFSCDEESGGNIYRNASCSNNHSVFFTQPASNTRPIEVDEVGYLIDDTKPGWEENIPEWVGQTA